MGGSCGRILFMKSTLLRTHGMPDAVGGWEFRDEDTIHCPRQLQVRQEKVRTWTKAVDRRMAGEHESERGLER